MVPLIVLACYQFSWHAWREFNCTSYLALSRALGLTSVRLSFDSFLSLHHVYRFEIACTAIDAYLGSIPLLWERGKSISWNTAFLSIYFVAVFAANMLRLVAGMLLYARGVPWWVGHEALAGVCYFILFLWIARRRGWTSYLF